MAKLISGTRIYGNVTVDTFVTATGNVPSYVKKRLLPPTDVYMTAHEMIEHGAADYILE